MNKELISHNEDLQGSAAVPEEPSIHEKQLKRNTDFSQSGDDFGNMLAGLQVPIVVLDSALRVCRFTPAAGQVLNLRATDIGRPIADLKLPLSGADLGALASKVIARATSVKLDVMDRHNRWHELSIRPYTTVEHRIGGILIALFDIDSLKRRADEARGARDFAEAIVETIRESLLVLDGGLRVVRATKHFYETFRVSPADTEGKVLYTLGNGQWNAPGLAELLDHVLHRNSRFDNFELEHTFPAIGRRFMVLNARRIEMCATAAPVILLAIEDVTEKKATEELDIQWRLTRAQEEERKRIARELHDDLIQELASMAVEMGRYAAKSPAATRLSKIFRSLQARIVRGAEVARRVAYDLHPSEIEDLGLEAAMHSYCEEFTRQKGVSVEFTCRHLPAALRPDILHCVYKVAMESLRNIAKHAKATQASVTFEGTVHSVRVSIEDDGIGFAMESLRASAGLGVVSMRERVLLVHGTFLIHSKPESGTQVIVEIPLGEGK